MPGPRPMVIRSSWRKDCGRRKIGSRCFPKNLRLYLLVGAIILPAVSPSAVLIAIDQAPSVLVILDGRLWTHSHIVRTFVGDCDRFMDASNCTGPRAMNARKAEPFECGNPPLGETPTRYLSVLRRCTAFHCSIWKRCFCIRGR